MHDEAYSGLAHALAELEAAKQDVLFWERSITSWREMIAFLADEQLDPHRHDVRWSGSPPWGAPS